MSKNKTTCRLTCNTVPSTVIEAVVLEFNKGFDIRVMTDKHPIKPDLPGISTKLVFNFGDQAYVGTVGGYKISTNGPSYGRRK